MEEAKEIDKGKEVIDLLLFLFAKTHPRIMTHICCFCCCCTLVFFCLSNLPLNEYVESESET